jgi:GAF domain-containing protein
MNTDSLPYVKINDTSSEFDELPFKSTLSFRPLIEFWQNESGHKNKLKSAIAATVLDGLKGAPELFEPIEDLSIISRYKEVVDLLMTIVYAPSQWSSQISTSSVPYQFKSFYSTPEFKRVFGTAEEAKTSALDLDYEVMYKGKIINAYLTILKKFYNVNVNTDTPVIIRIKDTRIRVYKYYRLNIDAGFTTVNCIGTLPVLAPEDINALLKDPYNIESWFKALPPENFEFEGFVTYTAIDVTAQEAVSALKFDLLEKESIISMERFKNLEDKLRSLFELPDLRMGLISLPEDWSMFMDYARKIGDSFLINDSCKFDCINFSGSIYEQAEGGRKPIIIEDLAKHTPHTAVEKELINQGLKNILIAPLYYKNKVIGVLELGSPNPGDINSLNWIKIKSVLMLFATAVKRSMEELDTQVQAVIKEECTAIHPSVEWRFRKAAVNLIFKREADKLAEMEEIVFENVYPLYGLSDIRNSSAFRNESITEDLIAHLELSSDIINSAYEGKNLPVLKELVYSTEKQIKMLRTGLNSGDEISVIEFIQDEIEPVFNHIKKFNRNTEKLIERYYSLLDPELNTIYSKRKNYEESVTLINETISKFLDESERVSQEMLPHYFEKYKTDGVEHGMYIGASLLRRGEFDMLYLKNLRLWQLLMVCGIVKKTDELKPRLKIPLETSHLILVQNKPLSIRFRMDEKKFDVDGTYNLRYEIMKKRIDKAYIKGTDERLTQPGKIAIIYSQPKEAAEYLRYLEYMESIGYIKGVPENFELEDLQGIHGLHALRVTVNNKKVKPDFPENLKDISSLARKMEDILN